MATRQPIGQVFISAHHDEYRAAENLEQVLVSAGYTVWWAAKVTNGTDWHGNIDLALQSCNCVVVLWSTKSAASVWVRHEASQAIARGIYVPVLLERVKLEEPYSRIHATFVDGLLDSSTPAGIHNVVDRVKALLPSSTELLLSRAWKSRWRFGSIAFAALVALSFWLVFTGIDHQVANLTNLTRETEKSGATQKAELAAISSNLKQSNDAATEVASQVRGILSAELDFAYVLGIDSRNAGYLRIENLGSGIATVRSVSITHEGRTFDNPDLLREMQQLGIRPFNLLPGQKISSARGVSVFGVPAKHIVDDERCISDKARKGFFEKLRITVTYTSPYSEQERPPLVWKYKNTNTVPCRR
jgi:TIR domain